MLLLGTFILELRGAILDVYSEQEFDELLLRMNKRRSDITTASGMEDRVLDVILQAERRGWIEAFVNAVYEERSDSPNLKRLYAELRSQEVQDPSRNVDRLIDGTSLLPDAGLGRLGPPLPTRAVAVVQDRTTALPVDVGMVWGLDRWPYIGLFGGVQEDLYGRLVRVERAIYDVQAQSSEHSDHVLPVRYWIAVDLYRFPNGPATKADVWRAVCDPDNALVHHVAAHGLPNNVQLGLFLTVDEPSVGWVLTMVQAWCDTIFRQVFSDTQVTMVLHFQNMTGSSAEASILKFKRALVQQLPGVPVKAMIALHTEAIAGSESNEMFFTNSDHHGQYLYAWFRQILAATRNTPIDFERQQQLAGHDAVISMYRRLRTQFTAAETDHPTLITVAMAPYVVRDIDSLIDAETADFDYQWLQLVQRHLPEYLHPLIRAYAGSLREQAQREAAIFAATTSDSLLDAWVAGVSLDAARFLRGRALYADPVRGPFAEAVILAILRHLQSTDDREPIIALLESLRSSVMTSDLEQVYALCIGETQPVDFFQDLNRKRVVYAIRAGLELDLTQAQIRAFGLPDPELWWLLASFVPNKQRISTLVQLPAPLRAIFGMCLPDEWSSLKRDPELVRQISDCRLSWMESEASL